MELNEQKIIQISMTIMRYVVVSVMSITSIVFIYSKYTPTNDGDFIYDSNIILPNINSENKPFVFKNVITLIPLCCFGTAYQFGIPSLTQPSNNKKGLSITYFMVSLSCFLLFTVLSITVSTFFGDYIESPCTLSWGNFKGFTPSQNNQFWVYIIRYFIVLFPGFDVVSAFPLSSVALSSNMAAVFLSSTQVKSKKNLYFIRATCALLPILLGAFVNNLGTILEFAGTAIIIVCFFFPALLEYKSSNICKDIMNDTEGHLTMYHKWFCDWKYTYFAMFVAMISFIGGIYGTIQDLISNNNN